MIDFYQESSRKEWKIEYDGGVFENNDIRAKSIEITEGINSEKELRFGGVISSSFTVTVENRGESLIGKELNVTLTAQDQTMNVGAYTVYKETLESDRTARKIVAYDKLYIALNRNVAAWYNNAFYPAKTIKQLRDSFFEYLGIEQEPITLCNDDLVVGKTLEAEIIAGRTVITKIMELNGCFGWLNRSGKFEYIVLKPMREGLRIGAGLHPSAGLRPRAAENATNIAIEHYISAQFEDFKTRLINKIQIRQDSDDIGGIYGDGDNCYIIQDNFLCYGMTTAQLQEIGRKILDVIGGIWYIPAEITAVGNLNIHVGDGIQVPTKYGTIMTYVLNRTLTGGQALRDKYTAEGIEKQKEQVGAVNDSIIRLTGKTNRLKRTVDELNSQLNDAKTGLQSQITQNADNIKLIVKQSFEGNMITDASIGALESFPKGQYTELDIDVVYGKGFTVSGSERLVGQLRLSATQYTLSFLMRSDNWQWTEPEIYLVDENGNETWIDLVAYGVHYGWWRTSGTFTAPASGSYYIKFVESADMGIQFSDLMLATGGFALDWTPNRTDEWSMISQTQDSISAKVEKTGGDASSFSWELLNDHFSLVSNNKEVFRVNDEGIIVNGYATIDYIQTEVIDTIDLKVENAIADNVQAINAEIDKLYANESVLGQAIADKLGAYEASITYATIGNLDNTNAEIQNLKANEAELGQAIAKKLSADQITTDLILGKLGGRTGTISVGTVNAYSGMSIQGHTLVLTSGVVGGKNMKWVTWS